MDMGTIAAALNSFNALKNIAQSMVALRDVNAFQAKVIEFNGALIDAQTKIFEVNQERTTLVERISSLEKEITDLKAWEAEKQRYHMIALAPNIIAYAVKEAVRGTEPPHYLCANCYAQDKKGHLQQILRGTAIDKYRCSRCQDELIVSKGGGGNWSPPRARGGGGNDWMGA